MAQALVPILLRSGAKALTPLLLLCGIAGTCHAQTGGGVVCRDGTGNFESSFVTGVTVQVRAARKDGLATRFCEGSLLWDKGKTVVAAGIAQSDVDAFGVDLGLGTPVVAFQVKKTNTECCMTLQIYSLHKPPKLLRIISGGNFFSSADTDLDGQIEIWTNDAASLIDFENPEFAAPDLAPTVILRFEHGRLLDVSSEFQGYFDGHIASLRTQLGPEELQEFKNSNGRLPPTAHFSQEDLRRSENLLRTKIKVLQIVWSYLYSGREEEAWKSLAEMWPPADLARIRAAIVAARAGGIRAQVDGVSAKISSGAEKGTEVVDARTVRVVQPGIKFAGRTPEGKGSDLILPTPILIERRVPQIPSEDTLPDSELLLDLVIDSAGKVRSAQSDEPSFERSLKSETPRWKFVPAFRSGRAVASRIYFIVSPKR